MKRLALAVSAALLGTVLSATPPALAAPASEWAEVNRLLAAITDAYTTPPALDSVLTNRFPAGLLLGNGDLAITADARNRVQTFYLAKSDFWHTGGQPHLGKLTIRSPRDTTATAAAKDTLECDATCVIDGNPETRWVSATNASTTAPQWVTVDLGQARTIDRWVVRHNGHPGRADNFQKLNTQDFALQRSDDGATWSDVDTVAGNTSELTDRTVPAFTARYLRLHITGAVRDPADPNQKAYLRDLQLFHGSTDLVAGGGDPHYHQRQNIRDAEVRGTQTIGGEVVHTRTWPADGENLLVTELWTDRRAGRLPIQVDISAPTGTAAVVRPGQVSFGRATAADTDTIGWVAKAGTSTKVLGAMATASTPSATTARLSFDLRPDRPVRLVTAIRGSGTYANTTPLSSFVTAAADRVARLDSRAVDRARDAHRSWWRQFWLKSYVDTGDATLNKFYYGGLYTVAAVNRAGFFPAGAYSPWRTSDADAGSSRYWLNYNTEAQYYGVYSANRPELADPYYRVIQAEIPYQRNRTAAAGYDGVTFARTVMPLNTTRPGPAPVPVAPEKNPDDLPSDQQTNGFFAAIPFLWDYDYTGDLEFFRDVTYPFLKELGTFWMDFVEKNPETGRYEVRHSAVNEGGDDLNPTYDLGYIRRNLTALIEGSKTLGVDASLRPVWQEVLDNLTPYPLGQRDGLDVILLANEINNPIKGNELLNKHDQPINLEGVVHPSDNLAIGGDPELLRLVRNTLAWVDPFQPGSRGSSINGFPKTFTIAARAGWDPEDLIGKFTTVINNLWRPNLTVRQSGGGQETSGSIETVNSMFLQTHEGVVRVFPAWPDGRDAKFVRLRAKGAFLLSSEQRSGEVRRVTVTSEKGNHFALANPWGTARVSVVDGHGQPVAHTHEDGLVSFPTRTGSTYHIGNAR